MSINPITILLIEDNKDHAELIIDTLEEFNIQNTINHVTNGELALAYLLNKHPYENPNSSPCPDLIMLDIKMPRLDGFGTLKEIKNNDYLKHIPVIMISTSSAEQEIKRCYELGANSYISKPVRFDEFSRKIKDINLYWVLTSELPRPS